jgi:uncharacterized phage protein (TIGR02218 family)
MSRTVSTALQNHLAGELTTLATCWRVQRRDGVVFYFTDHDQAITFEGETYSATSGYDRTAVSGTAGFKVDELNLSGFFTDGSLEESEMRNGLFDFAEITIFIVNYNDLSMGNMILRRGNLGEVEITPNGQFRAELRGLTQRLSQNIGEKYQAECRADVGDTRCKIPINPPAIQRNVAYERGQWVRVPTGNASALRYAVPLGNADFESGLTGWTTFSGNPTTISGDAFSGSRYLQGANPSAAFRIYQDVDLTVALDFDTAAADAGEISLNGSVRRITTADDQNDAGRFRVQALDTDGSVLSTLWDTEYEVIPDEAGWALRTVSDAVLPVGTRQLRVWCEGDQNTGVVVNAGFDNIQLELTDSEGAAGIYEIYENRIYEVVTGGTTAASQPVYNSSVGAQTTDGTVVLKSYQAWSRHATVDAVADQQEFTITVTEARAVDDWFNGGAVIWESGQNSGTVMEIKDWVASTSTITLYLPMPNAVNSGDRLRLYPGCDKRLNTCITKFDMSGSIDFDDGNYLNYRGEPYLPGRDQLARYPDAK